MLDLHMMSSFRLCGFMQPVMRLKKVESLMLTPAFLRRDLYINKHRIYKSSVCMSGHICIVAGSLDTDQHQVYGEVKQYHCFSAMAA